MALILSNPHFKILRILSSSNLMLLVFKSKYLLHLEFILA